MENNIILIEQKLEEVTQTNKNIENIDNENILISNIIIKKSSEELKVQKEIEEDSINKEIYMDKFYKEQENLKMINENINILDKEKNQKELSISKLDLENNNIALKLEEDYKLNFEEALLLENKIENVTNCRKTVKELKAKIKQLGNVKIGRAHV